MTRKRTNRPPSKHPHVLETTSVEARLIERIHGMLSFGSVHVLGLGIFWLGERPARRIRNPQTRELMELPATRELRFRAVKATRERIRAPRPSERKGP